MYSQVDLLQASNKRDRNLTVNNEKTTVQNNVIKFHHTDSDYSKMIRAYIDTVTSNNYLLYFLPVFFYIYHISGYRYVYIQDINLYLSIYLSIYTYIYIYIYTYTYIYMYVYIYIYIYMYCIYISCQNNVRFVLRNIACIVCSYTTCYQFFKSNTSI